MQEGLVAGVIGDWHWRGLQLHERRRPHETPMEVDPRSDPFPLLPVRPVGPVRPAIGRREMRFAQQRRVGGASRRPRPCFPHFRPLSFLCATKLPGHQPAQETKMQLWCSVVNKATHPLCRNPASVLLTENRKQQTLVFLASRCGRRSSWRCCRPRHDPTESQPALPASSRADPVPFLVSRQPCS